MSILTDSGPQFGTAEYGGQPGAERCKTCNQLLGARYYRVNGVLTCEGCGEKVKREGPQDTHAAFVRALLFGAVGALIGLAIYSTFTIITGLIIGYVSLAVGYIVGKAIMKGSRGIGGRRYQVAAVIFTYMAVSLSAIPIGISQIIKHPRTLKQSTVKQAPAETATDSPSEPVADADPDGPSTTSSNSSSKMSFWSAMGALVFAGLASPFLELQNAPSGIIGLIILVVGIRIAWKLTDEKSVDIVGPFSNTPVAPSTSPT